MELVTIIQIVLLPIIISIISNYGIWAFPYKKWKPNIIIQGINTNTKEVEKLIIKKDDMTGEEKEHGIKVKELKVRVKLVNATKRDAYRIDVYFEFKDKDDRIQYVRAEQRPLLGGGEHLTIEPSFKYEGIKLDKIDKVNINVAYQNKFGAIFSIEEEKKLEIL